MSRSTTPAQPPRRLESALGLSAAAHALVAVLVVLLVRHAASPPPDPVSALRPSLEQLVWLNQPGPGGGGGGGGNRMPGPIRRAEERGADRLSMPADEPAPVQPAAPEPPTDAPPPSERLDVPIQFAGASLDTRPGALDGTSASSSALGRGSGGGAGEGRGSGIGNGEGAGLGDGSGGGSGGGDRRPGGGVESPVLIREVKPLYTTDAMRAKIEGTAWLECVVLPDGTVGSVRIVRSLDASFGLDQEAIRAARLWRFRPGRRAGRPVPMLVAIGMDFHLR